MTLPVSTRVSSHIGNGSTTVFPYDFLIPVTVDVPQFDVYAIDLTTSERVDLVLDVDYSISGLGEPNGGEVTYPLTGDPITADTRLVIAGAVSYKQGTDIYNSGTLYLASIEDQLDNTTMQIQQLAEGLSRTFSVNVGVNKPTLIPGEAGTVPIWDGDGNLVPGTPDGDGNMFREIYDPGLVGQDVFDPKYHRGSAIFNGIEPSGVVDITSMLNAASATNEYLEFFAGTYLVSSSAVIPEGLTPVIYPGARFIRSGVGELEWNGGIVTLGGDRQQIFDDSWITGAYTRIGDTPYPIALSGTPKFDFANPFWFGINEGASVTGDSLVLQNDKAMHLALYWAKKMRIPSHSTIVMPRLDLRQDDMLVVGNGADSLIRICNEANLPATHRAGSVIGIVGEPPTTASGPPAKTVARSRVEKLGIDGKGLTNVNGVGMSFVDGGGASECTFFDVGRKALTVQYHCHGTRFEGCVVEAAVMEPSPTQAALSTEGQIAGVNFTTTGGVASTDDLLGADMTDNVYRDIRIKETGYGIITTSNAHNTKYIDIWAPDSGSIGTHIIDTRVSKHTQVIRYRGGDTSRRFIFVDTDSEDFMIDHAVFGDNISTLTDGYSIHGKGERSYFGNVEFDHSNTDVNGDRAVFIEGPDIEINRMHIRSNDAATDIVATSVADRLKIHDCKFFTPNSRTMLLGGSDVNVSDNYCDATSATTGIQVQGPRPVVTNNRILGNATNRVLVDGTTAAPAAYVVGNTLNGISAQINFLNNTLFSSVCRDNPGNINTGDNSLHGPNAVWQDATGDLRIMTTGAERTSDTDGVVVGTQT